MSRWPLVMLACLCVALGVRVLVLGNEVYQLEQRPAGPCAFLRAEALSPGAPGAPHDYGSLSAAAAARESYLSAGCVPAYGDLPLVRVPTGR